MPRSIFGNPVESAINAFGSVSAVLNQREELGRRRELMDRQSAESNLRMERERKNIAFEEKQRGRTEKLWGIEDELRDEIKNSPGFLNDFSSALGKDAEIRSGKEPQYTEGEGKAILAATGKMPHIDLNKLDEQGEAVNTFRKQLQHFGPQILGSKQQQILINREQAPELFSAFETM